MDAHLKALAASGIPAFESSFSALDAYLEVKPAPVRFALAACALQDLAKAFEGIKFPGTHYADAALDPGADPGADAGDRAALYLRCADSPKAAEGAAFAQLDLLRDASRDVFLDPKDVYPSLREKVASPRPAPAEQRLFESAVLVSRYPYELPTDLDLTLPRDFSLESQRDMLALMLTGATPERGLELLKYAGFIDAYWPELGSLSGTSQSKEYHPEGDAWVHTMETFRHRKIPALSLSLALLLHDVGKPRAAEAEGRKFDRHAEIGRSMAERFLLRLGFPSLLVADVSFLVRYHMLPAALTRLPQNRVEGVIDDPRFPILLELYKCDELSTFRGPDGYYEACAAYKAYLKNSRNPWRGADGKKLARMYLEESPRPSPPKKPAGRR